MKRLLILAALACTPFHPPRLVPLSIDQQPEEWAGWYAQLEKCSGKKGDFGGLAWYTTPDSYDRGHTFDGYWQPGGIVLHKTGDKELILHEMMHDLIKSGAHPKEYFKGKCGDLSLGEAL